MSKNSFIKQLVELTNSTSNLYSCIEELDKKLTTIRESNMELVSIYRILLYKGCIGVQKNIMSKFG